MKKLNCFLLICGIMLLVSSCKKDKEEDSKTEDLTGKYWKTTAQTVDPAIYYAGHWVTDWYSMMEDCKKDNLRKFDVDGTFTLDEGGMKCFLNDPQSYSGTWEFNDDKTIITINDKYGVTELTVIELTPTIFKAKYSVVTSGTTYTYTSTYSVN